MTRLRNIYLLISLMFGMNLHSNAQYNKDSPNTDRPGQAMNPNTVGYKVLQFQEGVNLGKIDWGFVEFNALSSFLNVRYGFSERWEINLTNGLATTFRYTSGNHYATDFQMTDLQIGVRRNIVKGGKFIPTLGLNASVYTWSATLNRPYIGGLLMLTTSNRWNKFSFNTNIGIGSYEGSLSIPYVFNLGVNISESLSVFGEIFGNWGASTASSFDAGFSYVLGKNFVIDLFGGRSIKPDIPLTYFVEVGMTARIDWRKEKGEAENSK